MCKYFVKGNCKFGTKCALLHTMSPYGGNNSSMKPPSLSFTGRRKTSDQMMNYSTSNSSLDHRSFLNDPFASSAPAVSLFHGEQLWRNQQTPRTNMIGVRSSPREPSDQLLGSSPLFNYRQQSSSLRSSNGGGYFNNHQYITGSNSMDDFTPQQQNGYDLNDAMLPSSLNDLFTPNELHARSLRQSRDVAQQSSFETQNQQWRVPSSFKEGTAAINIPCGNNSGSSGTGSSGSYLQGQHNNDDDEFQFFMEDDEAVTFDHLNNKPTPSYNMPTLISLPST